MGMIRLLASEWIRKEIKGLKKVEAPTVSSALIVKESSVLICENYLGYFVSKSNYVAHNTEGVILFSTPYKDAHGVSVIKENFYNCMALFTARKSIKRNWINDKDEYIEPIT